MPSRSALAFDALDRLVAHDSRGLRIWPAGSVSTQTPAVLERALPGAQGWGNGRFRVTSTAKTADGQNMLFVRSSSFFLWNANSVDDVTPVAPPVGWGADAGAIAAKGTRSAATGAEPITPLVRSVQIAPGADRIYFLEQIQGQGASLHAWAIERSSATSPARAVDLGWDLRLLGDGIINIALRGDGAFLAVGDRNGSVSLVDTRTRRIAGKIAALNQNSDNLVLAMAFSPDGKNLAIGSPEGTISIWSITRPEQPRLRFHLPGHRGIIFSLAFDAQNRRLASAGNDPLVEVWDVELLQRELARLGLTD